MTTVGNTVHTFTLFFSSRYTGPARLKQGIILVLQELKEVASVDIVEWTD